MIYVTTTKKSAKALRLTHLFWKKRKCLTDPFPTHSPFYKNKTTHEQTDNQNFSSRWLPHTTWHCLVSYLLLTVLCRVFDCMDEVVFHTPILFPLRVRHLSTTEQQQHKRNTASPRATGSPTKRTFYHIKSSAGMVEGQCIEKPVKEKPFIFIFYLYACLALYEIITNKCYLWNFRKKMCKKKNNATTTETQQKQKWRLSISLVVIHPSRQLSMQHLNKIDWLINDRQRAKSANPVS